MNTLFAGRNVRIGNAGIAPKEKPDGDRLANLVEIRSLDEMLVGGLTTCDTPDDPV